jgi:cellulose biosynthesis protein BcsQ
MYVTTFYSYKGGVGRSMALANVGVLLAKAGNRVLLVDFDLEAPGLPSYGPLGDATGLPGIHRRMLDRRNVFDLGHAFGRQQFTGLRRATGRHRLD